MRDLCTAPSLCDVLTYRGGSLDGHHEQGVCTVPSLKALLDQTLGERSKSSCQDVHRGLSQDLLEALCFWQQSRLGLLKHPRKAPTCCALGSGGARTSC